jgi:hypothetical protein
VARELWAKWITRWKFSKRGHGLSRHAVMVKLRSPIRSENPYSFLDDETDLLCHGSRFYNADLGRWIRPVAESEKSTCGSWTCYDKACEG